MNPRILSTLAVTGLALMGAQSAVAQVVKIDGSSTVYPVTEAVAEDFQKAKKNAVKVTVGISGTGGGFKKFCRGETDISDASRPILKAEMEICKQAGIQYYELPVAFDEVSGAVKLLQKEARCGLVASRRQQIGVAKLEATLLISLDLEDTRGESRIRRPRPAFGVDDGQLLQRFFGHQRHMWPPAAVSSLRRSVKPDRQDPAARPRSARAPC